MKHPCHQDQITGLKRIEGQVKGIQLMIDEGKYCLDILNQIKAAKSALTTVETKVLNKHIKESIKKSLSSETELDQKVDELIRILKR